MKKLFFTITVVLSGLLLQTSAHADDTFLVSGMGGKCLDAEGGIRDGVRFLGYQCHGGANQKFTIPPGQSQSIQIKMGGLCLSVRGNGNERDPVILQQCGNNRPSTQLWNLSNNELVSAASGRCVDLEGGAGHFFGNQPAILFNCHHQSNQKWYVGKLVNAGKINNAHLIQPGQRFDIRPIGGNVINAGGANVINAGGANVIAAGGGNVIAVGGAN